MKAFISNGPDNLDTSTMGSETDGGNALLAELLDEKGGDVLPDENLLEVKILLYCNFLFRNNNICRLGLGQSRHIEGEPSSSWFNIFHCH